MQRRLNIHYATIHGSYWMVFAVLYSFSSVYLLSKGYSNSEIGLVLALGNLLAVIIQPFLADLADRRSKATIFTMMVIMNLIIMASVTAMIFMEQRSLVLSCIYVIALATLMAIQPFANAVNRRLEETGVNIYFGICRALGSFAYSVLCLVLGALVEAKGTMTLSIAGEITTVLAILMIGTTYMGYKRGMRLNLVQEKGPDNSFASGEAKEEGDSSRNERPEEQIDLMQFLSNHKLFIVMSVGVLGLYFSNAAINMYMAQIADSVGGNNEDTGRVFSLLAFMEIPTLLLFDRICRRFKVTTLLKFSSIAFVIWIGSCSAARSIGMLLGAQIFQAFAFALFLPSMVQYIDDHMREGEAIKGQMVFTAVTTSASIISGLIGGRIIDLAGAHTLTVIGTVITALGAITVHLTLNKAKALGRI